MGNSTIRQTNPTQRIAEIVDEYLPDIASREGAIFDELAAPFNGAMVIVGAGGLGAKLVRGLAQLGIYPVAITDNNQASWGSTIDGIDVIAPHDAAARFGDRAVFVLAIWTAGFGENLASAYTQMISLGCRQVVTFAPLFWRNPEIFLPHFRFAPPSRILPHRDEIVAAFSLWSDEVSQNTYLAHLEWLCGRPAPLSSWTDEATYFDPATTTLSPDEVFVDAGAFDGDTMHSFLRATGSRFQRFFAFEPDRQNLAKLAEAVNRLPAEIQRRIEIRGLALGQHASRVRFSEGRGLVSKVCEDGSQEVEVGALDELLDGLRPTSIKMDIEGAEPDALLGAAKIIAAHAPKLAICVYHEPEHLWQLPLLIHSLNPVYSLKLRHYRKTSDLVCYAMPGGARE